MAAPRLNFDNLEVDMDQVASWRAIGRRAVRIARQRALHDVRGRGLALVVGIVAGAALVESAQPPTHQMRPAMGPSRRPPMVIVNRPMPRKPPMPPKPPAPPMMLKPGMPAMGLKPGAPLATTAEREALRAERDAYLRDLEQYHTDLEQFRAELERLRAEAQTSGRQPGQPGQSG
jgi:hypothetical protein